MSQLRSLCSSTFMLTIISINKASDAGWDPISNYSSARIHTLYVTMIYYIWLGRN